MENASSGVHSAVVLNTSNCYISSEKYSQIHTNHISMKTKGDNLPFFVGFDIAKIAGLVEVEPFMASKTLNTISQQWLLEYQLYDDIMQVRGTTAA